MSLCPDGDKSKSQLLEEDTARRESEERFAATFEQAAVGIAHVALNEDIDRLNTVPTPTLASGNPGGPGPPERVRILLVEDHEDTLHVMTRLLRSLGHSVRTATSVRAALDLAGREEFDLLISDLGLPDGSGTEIMRRIKPMGPGRPLRGIALTGFGMEEDLRRSREAGFETHLTKPVDFQTLEAAIRRLVSY